jgi:hypothetical protein
MLASAGPCQAIKVAGDEKVDVQGSACAIARNNEEHLGSAKGGAKKDDKLSLILAAACHSTATCSTY